MGLIKWCEQTQSKIIVGGTLLSQADGKTSTNAQSKTHEVQLKL
jgi:phage gp29-like protein